MIYFGGLILICSYWIKNKYFVTYLHDTARFSFLYSIEIPVENIVAWPLYLSGDQVLQDTRHPSTCSTRSISE